MAINLNRVKNPEMRHRFESAFATVPASIVAKMNIRSGDRDPKHNAAVGGAKHSQHIEGKAVDIDVSGLSNNEKGVVIKKFAEAGAKGFGIYTHGKAAKVNSLHIDFRDGPVKTWGKNGSHSSNNIAAAPEWSQAGLQLASNMDPPPAAQPAVFANNTRNQPQIQQAAFMPPANQPQFGAPVNAAAGQVNNQGG